MFVQCSAPPRSLTHTYSYEWKRERRSEITQRLTSLTEAMNENLWWGNTAKQETCGTPVQSRQKHTPRRTATLCSVPSLLLVASDNKILGVFASFTIN